MKRRLLFLFSVLLMAIPVQSQDDTILTDSIYAIADRNPIFPGCSDAEDIKICSQRELYTWIFRRMEYPISARNKKVSGTTVTSFVIDKTGRMGDIRILKEPGEGLGDEVLRLLELMQSEVTWEPALISDQKVNFRYVLPVKFKLESVKEDTFTDKYLVFKAWGGREVFRGMVTEEIQAAIPDAFIKNVETYDFQKSKAVYNVIGNAHLVHFRPKKLARPQELMKLKSSELWELGLEGIQTRYIAELDQLNISIPKVQQSLRYYIYDYIGDVLHEGRLRKSNGIIEKVDLSKAKDGVLFISFVHDEEYATALALKSKKPSK